MRARATKKEINDGVKDKFGVLYSADGTRLLKCTNDCIETYSIQYGTEIICDNAFCNCTLLKEVYVHDSVTEIGNGAFAGCVSLNNIVLPDSLLYCDKSAFYNCKSLYNIIIPEDTKERFKKILPSKYWDYLKTFDEMYGIDLTSQKIPIIEYSCDGKTLTCYETLFMNDETKKLFPIFKVKQGVETISESAFHDDALKTIILPNSLKVINNCAFAGCQQLETIVLPRGLKKIGDWAFKDCESIRELTIPTSVCEIGVNPFVNCNALTLKSMSKRFIVEDNMLIDNQTKELISYNGSAKSVVIPSAISKIRENAFAYCSSLEHIFISGNNPQIEASAFLYCTALHQLVNPHFMAAPRCERLRFPTL